MELRSLRAFVMLADIQNFTRAAARLRISQPSLTMTIRKLEAQLGVELFHRTKRSVELTPAAHAILVEARSLLSQAEITHDVARLAASGEIGGLGIGFIESAVFAALPPLVSRFRARYPKVRIVLHEMSTMEQVAALRDRRIDVGIFRMPIQGDDIHTESLLREPIVVALQRTHPLARNSSIRLRALRQEQFLLYARPHATRLRDEIIGLCRQAGFAPSVAQEVEEFHTLCGLVAAGLGVSFVPSSARVINISGVVYRKLANPTIGLDYSVGWLKKSGAPALKAFQTIL